MNVRRAFPAVLGAAFAAACSTKPAAQTATAPPPAPPTVVRLEPTPAPPPAPARMAEDAIPASVEEINRRGYLKDAFFAYDESAITSEDRDVLAKDAAWLRAHPAIRVRVEGYCDERGTAAYTRALGERRAAAVREYLQAAGVGAARIAILSYGEERPFAPGHDESAWSQNRRGHFVVTASAP
jgi:peptidoglycan-associated lipoprotein